MFLKKKHYKTNENECNLTLRWKAHCKGKKYFHGRKKAMNRQGRKELKRWSQCRKHTQLSLHPTSPELISFDFQKASFWTNQKKDGVCPWEVARLALHLWAMFVSGCWPYKLPCGPLFGQVSWAGFVRCCPGLFWFPWRTNRHTEDLSLILSGSTAVTPPLSLTWPPDLTVVPR